jgi:hypothetical protein
MGQTTQSFRRITALGAALLVPTLTWAQNCALCYTQAAGAGPRMISALKSGIAVLVFSPMAICLAIAYMAYKKRNQFRQFDYTPESDPSQSQDG